MRRFGASLTLIQESNARSRASAGVDWLSGVQGRGFRAAASDREFADVVAFMLVRRTGADPGAYVARFILIDG